MWSLTGQHLVLLLLLEAAALLAEVAALTVAAETTALTETSLLTRKSGVHSLVGVGDDVVGEVEELSQVLETRISESVVEVAPNHKFCNQMHTSCRSCSRIRGSRGTGAA